MGPIYADPDDDKELLISEKIEAERKVFDANKLTSVLQEQKLAK